MRFFGCEKFLGFYGLVIRNSTSGEFFLSCTRF